MKEEEKTQWLDSIQIVSGLKYFGGKKFIGKYLINRILNMAVKMHRDGHEKQIFVDAFTGGGKIALSMPVGWFDKIVMNDYNYGVYNYFINCKENPEALVKMIEILGTVMSKGFSEFCVQCRSEKKVGSTKMEPLVSAAMTYWATQVSFNGIIEKERYTYNLEGRDNKSGEPTREQEKEAIEGIIRHAQKNIPLIHERMERLNIIVENMDYKELIKKYNGMKYFGRAQTEEEKEKYKKYQKLWYFDPPYHPATLYKGNQAPYEDTFDTGDVDNMTKLLHGDDSKTYGDIEYFIKSDYDPKYVYKEIEEKIKDAEMKLSNEKDEDRIKKYNRFINEMKAQLIITKNSLNDFDILEDNIGRKNHKANTKNPVFYKEFLGEFSKGVMDAEGVKKAKGGEYIWCRGNYIP